MTGFWENAKQILEAAENVVLAGEIPSQMSILLGGPGGIHIVADSDWPLDSLQREYGAKAAYRVNGGDRGVTVDGRDGQHTCHLESASIAQMARALLNAAPCSNQFA